MTAWSQNLGHEEVSTTLRSYGVVPVARQAELICGMGGGARDSAEAVLERLVDRKFASLLGTAVVTSSSIPPRER